MDNDDSVDIKIDPPLPHWQNAASYFRTSAVDHLFDIEGAQSLLSDAEKTISAKLLWAHKDGSPVAPSNEVVANEMAIVARRRWNSFGRRHKNIPDTLPARIEDLARGLAEKFTDGGWPMVGPLISDYRWLAETIAPLFDSTGASNTKHEDWPRDA